MCVCVCMCSVLESVCVVLCVNSDSAGITEVPHCCDSGGIVRHHSTGSTGRGSGGGSWKRVGCVLRCRWCSGAVRAKTLRLRRWDELAGVRVRRCVYCGVGVSRVAVVVVVAVGVLVVAMLLALGRAILAQGCHGRLHDPRPPLGFGLALGWRWVSRGCCSRTRLCSVLVLPW